ncbi:hypothetical protein [Paractinoplanes hotanensis]|uniref:Uncharacterized protein n=1 Tax=Paractinoplanes hotanensis TaxID=2906497 RepID=A0ABT0XVS9_9ACTN|nr:hypothetical protein [Actinoplanes hotanensis]MCM4077896.1 hypothetical protein [Actinoplanes hotanensis]
MRRSARRFAALGPIVGAGALLHLLVPLAVAAKVTGAEALRSPIVWLCLHLFGWVAIGAVLLGRRRHSAGQLRLSQEAEQLNRSIALYRAAIECPLAGRPDDDQIGAIVDRIDDLLVALRPRDG